MNTDRELMQKALEALEKLRVGLLTMREHAESYGESWARAYVKEYREMLPGSAEEQFRALNTMQHRLADVAEGVIQGYDAITALRKRLEHCDRCGKPLNGPGHIHTCTPKQPAQQQEPVMVDMQPPATQRDRWMYEQGRLAERDSRTHADRAWELAEKVRTALDRQSCPGVFMNLAMESIVKHYTSPPASKPWVGLTDAEIRQCEQTDSRSYVDHARAIEAKLREKNA